jgi:hypothetical protein
MGQDVTLIREANILGVLGMWGFGMQSKLDDVHNFATALRPPVDPTRLSSMLAPKLKLDRSRWQSGTAGEYLTTFMEQHTCAPDIQRIGFDGRTPRLSRATISKIGAWWRAESANMEYVPEGSIGNGDDCDGFALALKGRLAMLGYGDAIQVVRTPQHAFCACWEDTGAVLLIEPQGFTIEPPGYTGIVTGLIW